MLYVERPAPAGLEAFVTKTWFLRAPRLRPFEKILPLPFPLLILNLSDPYRLATPTGEWVVVDGAFVSGVQPTYLVIENPETIVNAGVELTPAGLPAFSTTAPADVVARVRDAAPVLPGSGELCRAARATPEPDAVLDAIEAFLRARLRPDARPDPVVERALDLLGSDRGVSVTDVARLCGVSHRTLIVRFRRSCGLTPKAWSDVLRFHRLVSSLPIGPQMPTWAEVAAESRFFDQPHVVRAFRRFTGFTPSAYLRAVARYGPDAATFVPLDQVPPDVVGAGSRTYKPPPRAPA